ncbi:KH_1 domain-containing protein/AKAP7_NLS domain-containing protein [Cephalotus follicularis]|uniref:KH_1 domain-containing protein/AKAP7_NLS domain-containing protein n=1 Tax=Cephalotus follicularis TaxID=3775 RepID=A0A1Q3CBE9_CEPFO|nr:KH_1 domain-containing protein/AKAP7_NLS domain-containing protein [Cephalotus follicularis]
MLARRALLIRVDRILRHTNTHVKSRLVNSSQGLCYYNSLSCNKGMHRAKDKTGIVNNSKKWKEMTHVWRPVCTQVTSVQGCLVNDVTVDIEDESQVQEVHCGISSNVSVTQHVTEVEAVDEVRKPNPSSSALQDNVVDGALDGDPVSSTAKQSLSEVGASVIRFLEGMEGSLLKKIEEEIGVRIIIPSSKKKGTIVIEGNSVDSVTRALERVQLIIDEAVKSPRVDYSHFISLPLAIYPGLVDKLVNFQTSILGNSDACLEENLESDSNEDASTSKVAGQRLDKGPDVAVKPNVHISSMPLVSYAPKASKVPTSSDLGIAKSTFIKPKTFHLTVLMLKLWNKERVNSATELLKSISSKVMDALDNRPVFVRLKGLDCMRGPWSKARVLYVPVEEVGSEDRLLRACQIITDAFVDSGLVLEKDAKQKLKLHATVMNARHSKSYKGTRKLDYFDARGILKQFGSEHWGEYLIREAHLSERFKFDVNGYYHCCASIPFPENMKVD